MSNSILRFARRRQLRSTEVVTLGRARSSSTDSVMELANGAESKRLKALFGLVGYGLNSMGGS